ncbi:MAG: hypothetical protein H7Y00_12990, partial [Fimbriimonadaceae bacterium]|nr:hypothetical protein [Chitinophagales bacterium]
MLRQNIYALFLVCILSMQQVSAQLIITSDTTICSGGSVFLSVISSPSFNTDSYTVDSIPFSSEAHAGTNAFPAGDDDIDLNVDIGFTFCFFGNDYDECYISTNGWVSFTDGPATWNTVYGPGGTPTYNLPNTNTNVPKNCIFGPWQDWDPNDVGSHVKYQTLGTAPYRRFVVSFDDIVLFGFGCASDKGTFQIVLYETTNIIQNHIIEKENCTDWENGKATQAIHNSDGTVSVEVSGRDATDWTASDESWQYTPSGLATGVEWYIGGTLIGTGDSLLVSPIATTTYTATMQSCDGTNYSADVTVTVVPPDDASFSYDASSYCLDGSVISPDYIATAGGIFSATPAGMDIDPSTGAIDLSSSLAGTYTVEYLVENVCPDSNTALVTILDYDNAAFSYASTTFCPIGSVSPTYVATLGGTFTVSPAGLTINASTGTIDLTSGTTYTTYTITYNTSGTCPSSSSLDIMIEDFEDASFSYDASSYCPTGETTPTITGTAGGTFTVSPTTITISSSTGELDLSTGDVGTTYTITYTTSGYCWSSETATVLIDPLDDASFGYSDPSYCPTGTILPDFITTSGGTFSVTPIGLVVDVSTGEV